jgi:hypothetical protein
MLIKLIGDPRRLVEVRTFLEARPDCIVRQLGDDELEVFLLGSFSAEAHRSELERLPSTGRCTGR